MFEGLGGGKEVATKGPRMAMCRFHSVVPVLEHLLQIWHSRLLVWLYMGIQLGYVDVLQNFFMVTKLDTKMGSRSQAADKRTSKEEQKESLYSFRADSKNTLHFATRMLMDATWHRKAIGE